MLKVDTPPNTLGNLLTAASLVILHFAFFWRAALIRGVLVNGDILFFFEPMKRLLHESLRQGRLPLWSPFIFCGYPVAAEGQIGAFYPLSLFFSWLLPSSGAINWLIITHLSIAAVSMFLLARCLGGGLFGAWLSGFVFSFSGYLFAHLHHVSLICASTWLPLVILFVERSWRGHLLLNSAFAAIAFAAAALSGHPQTVFFISLVVIFWLIWRLVQGPPEAGAPIRHALVIAATVFSLGIGLGAVQLLPTVLLAASSPHGEPGDLSYITSFSLLPRHLIGLILPNWQGTPAFGNYQGENYYWEYVLYLGLVPLIFVLFASITKNGRIIAILAIAALALAIAQGNPLYQVLQYVPIFSHFRAPARFIFIFTFAASLLACYGWQWFRDTRLVSFGRRSVMVGAIICLLTICDLWVYDRTLAPLAHLEFYDKYNPIALELKKDKGWRRALIIPPISIKADWTPLRGWARNPDGWAEARAMLPADVAQSYGIRIIDGYAGFTDPRQAEFFQAAVAGAAAGNFNLLSLVGTRYLAVGPQVNVAGLPSMQIPPFVIYRNSEAFPRAFMVGEIISANNSEEALVRTIELAQTDRLPVAGVVQGMINASAVELPKHTNKTPSKGKILGIKEIRPERIIVKARSAGESLLVLNERWDPGWQTIVNGRRTPALVVDTMLIGIILPAGEHTAEFMYQSRGFVLGRAISLLSFAVCVGLLLGCAIRMRTKKPV